MAASFSTDGKRVLSVFTLVMINVIAVDSLRTIPFGATFGLSLIFYYLLAALTFFIPSALVAAELASAWPKTGGVYVWVSEAFGPFWGVIVAWIQWIYNICWFPTILSLLAATIAYLINPELVNNKTYMVCVIFSIYWLTTLVNAFGMRASGLLSSITAIVGTLLPMLLIIGMGAYWLFQGYPIQIEFSWNSAFPKASDFTILVLLTNVLFGLLGVEMSAVHAQEVKNPQRDYPRALFLSAIIILFTLVGSSLAVAMIVPKEELSLVSGLLDAFKLFLDAYSLPYLMPLVAIFIIIGGIGGLGAWIIGPSKAILASAQSGDFFSSLKNTNRFGAPVKILLVQGILFTFICSIFLFSPTVHSAFWILSNLTSQLALLGYTLMFAAAISLRYTHAHTPRPYHVPGNNMGMWIVAGAGLLASFLTFLIGFLPPSGEQASANYYRLLFSGHFLLLGVPVVIFAWIHRRKTRVHV